MFKEIALKISQYDSIVIFRHTRPDLDALGSQIGLKHLISQNFENKKVYVVGDMNKFDFLGQMDEINDDIIKNSLAIICDVATKRLVSDDRYALAKEIIVIDHHKNECDIENSKTYVDITAAAACQMIANFAIDNNLFINKECATALYSGLITDSGRFMYGLTKDLFNVAGVLIDAGAVTKWVYDQLYSETLQEKKMKAYFISKFEVTPEGIAYMFNDKDVFDIFNVDVFTISRGMVNCMAGIEGIEIWANFTYDISADKVLCEFRSKNIEIVGIAKKYGGGGHANACGATVDSFEIAKLIIEDFKNLIRGEK